jgi:hypothetical protein
MQSRVNRCSHMHLPHAASSPDGVKRDKNSTSDAANATRVLAAAPIWAIVVATNAAGARRRIPRELACIGHCRCRYLSRLRQRVVNMRVVVNIIQLLTHMRMHVAPATDFFLQLPALATCRSAEGRSRWEVSRRHARGPPLGSKALKPLRCVRQKEGI